MAERWRRCESCRKVKPVEDFAGEDAACLACAAPAAGRAGRGQRTVTAATRTARVSGGELTAVVRTASVQDLRGRGDPQVRARRARVRALDRLAEQYAEEFAALLTEERRAEGL